jgi:hypothetical protein
MKQIWFVLIVLWSIGCAKRYLQEEGAYEYEQYDQQIGGYADEDYSYNRGAPAPKQKSVKSLSYKGYEKKESKADNQQDSASKMIHYNGYANLQVARPEETIEEIVTIAKNVEGNIERRSTKSITIRVPKEKFSEVFAQVIELGDVISKSVTSEDITEAFTSVELRLQTARTTRDRLIALLEKTDDEKEKINILRQIQRLNEQIDVIEAQMRTLQNLADLSSISVDLTARKAISDGPSQVEPFGFSWIHNLSPFQNNVCSTGKRLEFETPEGLVSLHPKGSYIAESADGTVLRATKLQNNPNGSSSFWQQAIFERLQGGFGKAEKGNIGEFATVTLREDSDTPYVWVIAVKTDSKWLEFIEIYYPSEQQEDRYKEAIEASITGGAL